MAPSASARHPRVSALALALIFAAGPALSEEEKAPAAATPAEQAGAPAACENDAAVADLRARLKECEAKVDELERRLRGSQPKSSGVIPHVLVGPELSLLSVPSPAVGIEARLWQLIGLSIEYGFIPRLGISDIHAKYSMWMGTLKVFPFRGAFFLGMAVGKYKFTATQTSGSQTVAETDIRSTVVGPQLGWRWISSSGFFTGLDLGYAFAASYQSTLAPPGAGGTIGDIKSNADKYVQEGIPVIGLLRLGWFF